MRLEKLFFVSEREQTKTKTRLLSSDLERYMKRETMATAKDVAEWMAGHFGTAKYLYQDTVVYKIKKQFGDEFVYTNENGNSAIGKDVLKHFREITEGNVVWEKGSRAWRMLRNNETYKGRQTN